jgi:hypothetical protein
VEAGLPHVVAGGPHASRIRSDSHR